MLLRVKALVCFVCEGECVCFVWYIPFLRVDLIPISFPAQSLLYSIEGPKYVVDIDRFGKLLAYFGSPKHPDFAKYT